MTDDWEDPRQWATGIAADAKHRIFPYLFVHHISETASSAQFLSARSIPKSWFFFIQHENPDFALQAPQRTCTNAMDLSVPKKIIKFLVYNVVNFFEFLCYSSPSVGSLRFPRAFNASVTLLASSLSSLSNFQSSDEILRPLGVNSGVWAHRKVEGGSWHGCDAWRVGYIAASSTFSTSLRVYNTLIYLAPWAEARSIMK